MREIIRTLINEGVEVEDIINITRFLMEGRKEGESQSEFKQRLANELTDKTYNNYLDELKKGYYIDQNVKKHPNKKSKAYDQWKKTLGARKKFEKVSDIALGSKTSTDKKSTESVADEDSQNIQYEIRQDNK